MCDRAGCTCEYYDEVERERDDALDQAERLRRGVVPAHEALDVLVDVMERFTTEAEYTVAVSLEEELTTALDCAREMLREKATS